MGNGEHQFKITFRCSTNVEKTYSRRKWSLGINILLHYAFRISLCYIENGFYSKLLNTLWCNCLNCNECLKFFTSGDYRRKCCTRNVHFCKWNLFSSWNKIENILCSLERIFFFHFFKHLFPIYNHKHY